MKELRDLFTPRDIPLLFVVLPQAYTVALWQWQGSGAQTLIGTGWQLGAWVALAFAILGGIGYEAIYVGAVAWARKITGNRWAHFWAFLTAVFALGFSVGVAVYVYRAQGSAAWLHAGFPLVAFFYTVMTFAAHGARAPAQVSAADAQPEPLVREEPAQLVARLRESGEGEREIVGALRAGFAHLSNRQIAALVGRPESTVRGWP